MMVEADFSNKGEQAAVGLAVGGTGHEQDFFVREIEIRYERPILLARDHKFEPRVRHVGKGGQHGWLYACRGVAGVRQLGRHVPLIHALHETGRGKESSVGFHLNRQILREQREKLFEVVRLQQRLPAGDNDPLSRHGQKALGHGSGRHLQGIAPSVFGIAPRAMQITAGQAQECSRRTRACPLPLQRGKEFRCVIQTCNKHGYVLECAVSHTYQKRYGRST